MARLLIVGEAPGDDILAAMANDGHDVTHAADGEVAHRRFDVVVVLGTTRLVCAWCTQFRAGGGQTPVLVVIDEPTTSARVSSLDGGADDVLVRPLVIAELRAHVRALARRGPLLRQNEVIRGDARLDFAARRAWLGEREIALTPGEWKIVDYLEMNAGRVASRTDILEALYGEIADARKASLEVLIGRIRRKLGTSFIRTVRGRGYAVG